MATFAVMSGDLVTNVIVADNQAEAESVLNVTLIEYTVDNPAWIGSTYDAVSGTFIQPI
jgi:hypothetical protein